MARPDDLPAWLRLLGTPGIGRESARRLLAACGSPEAVFAARPATLRELLGPPLASALSVEPEGHAAQLAATEAWLGAAAKHHILTLGEPGYPSLLLETADPPLLCMRRAGSNCSARPHWRWWAAAIRASHWTTRGRSPNT